MTLSDSFMKKKRFPHMSKLLLSLTFFSTLAIADVRVEAFGNLKSYPTHSLASKVIALRESNIGSLINANVIEINAHEGDEIKKGTWLIKLDCFNSKIQFDQRKSAYELNELNLSWDKKELTRMENLVKKKHLAQAALDSKQRQLESKVVEQKLLKINLRQAQKEVDRCTLYAPYDSTVIKRHANLGEFATAGKTLVTLLDTKNTLVETEVPLSLIEDFKNASSHWLQNGEKRVNLTIKTMLPQANLKNNSRTVRLTADEALLIGEQSRIWWTSNTPRIDGKYLHRYDGDLGIWVESDEDYRFIPLPTAQEGRNFDIQLDDAINIVTRNVHLITKH